MTIAEKLDLAIKLKVTGTTDGAYVIERGNGEKIFKATYMTKTEWTAFEADMKANALQPKAYTEYGKGGGDELTEKNGRPPKMASYGSSSRMIYTLSRNKAGFHYEDKRSTSIGGTANLDGFYDDEDGNRYIFVEAKCREPYSNKSNSVSIAYKDLYDFINTKTAVSMKITMIPSKCGRYMNVDYVVGKEKLEYFDIKQMICHLLGIATALLKSNLERKQIDFIYLLYQLPHDERYKRYSNDTVHSTGMDKLFRIYLLGWYFKDDSQNSNADDHKVHVEKHKNTNKAMGLLSARFKNWNLNEISEKLVMDLFHLLHHTTYDYNTFIKIVLATERLFPGTLNEMPKKGFEKGEVNRWLSLMNGK